VGISSIIEVGRTLDMEHELWTLAVLDAGDGEIVSTFHHQIGAEPAAGVRDYQEIVAQDCRTGSVQ